MDPAKLDRRLRAGGGGPGLQSLARSDQNDPRAFVASAEQVTGGHSLPMEVWVDGDGLV